MSNESLQYKIQDLLEKTERLFQTEWRKTKLNLDHEMIDHFISSTGTFLEPGDSNTAIPWESRDEFLTSYRNLLAELEDVNTFQQSPVQSLQPQNHQKQSDVSPDLNKASIPTQKADASLPMTKAHAIPKPQTLAHSIQPSGETPQWPGVVTGPIAVGPASAQGFPNPFTGAIHAKDPKAPTPMTAPHAQVPAIQQQPSTMRAIAAKEKFAHLLHGVQTEVIRDFILAEGTNSGTGKPTVIIYTLENIWLEFAFDYAEGSRILHKYPQRDPELIEFMKAEGHK